MKYFILIIIFITVSLAQEKQLYTCGMHPNVVTESPGLCPICEMDLTPIKKETVNTQPRERNVLYWRAPMNPNEIYQKPGKSNMGMDLVPVYADELEGTTVKISASLQQNMGVRTTKADKKQLLKDIKTSGTIQFDETRLAHLSLKVNGWIEKLHVNFVGQHVEKGQVLFELYSPELINAQQEYLTAYNSVKILGEAGNSLLESAKNRLRFWDISEPQLESLRKKGKPNRTTPIYSPFSGVVTVKNLQEGHFVKQGNTLLEVADLSKVWLIIDLYEKDLPFISVGQHVFATLPYHPSAEYSGTIDYIFPTLELKTRTVKARVVLHNPQERLKVNMIANAKIKADMNRKVISVPSEAVILTGARSVVIIDNGDQTFSPRNVKLGMYFNGFYEIISGLMENETIVTSAQFLIDSESKLKEAIQKLIQEKTTESPTQSEQNTATTTISLPSIQCDQCIETITTALSSNNYISSVHIDLETKTAHIGYQQGKTTPSDIEKLIANSGYHANTTKRLGAAYQKLAACCKEE